MTEIRRTMPETIAVEMRAEDLPESIVARMKDRPVPGLSYRVTAEPLTEPDERLEALRRDLAAGIADSEAGRWKDGDAVFARLRAKYGPSS